MRPTTRSRSASRGAIRKTYMDTTATTTTTSEEVGTITITPANPPISSAIVPLSPPAFSIPFPLTHQQYTSSTPSPFQTATLAALVYMQAQLASATRTISNMQAEIDTLKEEIKHATQQTTQNQQLFTDSEVRIKTKIKTSIQDFTQQLQDIENRHQKQHTTLQEHTGKIQSLKDSQQHFHADIKKQLQSLSASKPKQTTTSQTHSPKPCPTAVTDPSTDARYTVPVNNRYTLLADSADPIPTSPSPPSSPLLPTPTPSPSGSKRKAPSDQSNRAAPTEHAVTDQRPSPRRLVQQHTKAAPLQHTTVTDPRPSPRRLMQQQAVPPDCNTLLLGDSIMRRVDEEKISVDGARVKNLAVSGLTVADLGEWLFTLSPSPHIKRVVFHVGINNCREGPVSAATWHRIVALHKRAFPQASLQASSILPPFGRHPLTPAASCTTANLRRVCQVEGVEYTDHTPSFLSPAGAPKRAMYRPGDSIHPSEKGVWCFAQNILLSWGPLQYQQPTKRTSPPNHSSPRPNPWLQGQHLDQPNTMVDPVQFPIPTPHAPDAPEVTRVLGRRATHTQCTSQRSPDTVPEGLIQLLTQALRPLITHLYVNE